MATPRLVHNPYTGTNVVFVPRDQLRITAPHARFTRPAIGTLKGLRAPLPKVIDWSDGRRIKFPTLGNDRYGDCFYAECLHAVQCWLGLNGPGVVFDPEAVIRRYLQLSGGDNGLSDSQMMPEFMAGVIGPNGPHKLLGYMTVDPSDEEAVREALYVGCGVGYTCAMLTSWLANMRPGAVWDAKGRQDQNSGHAMLFSGIGEDGRYRSETWGFDPPVSITRQGMLAADPEVILHASHEQFNAKGYNPAGMHYTAFREWWQARGGKPLPPSSFPDPQPEPGPGPEPGPIPVPTGSWVVDLVADFGTLLGGLKVPIRGTVGPAVTAADNLEFDGRGVTLVTPDGTRRAIPWDLLFAFLLQLLPLIFNKARDGDPHAKRFLTAIATAAKP